MAARPFKRAFEGGMPVGEGNDYNVCNLPLRRKTLIAVTYAAGPDPMKITTVLTALALVATSAATTVAISDWRNDATEAINGTLEVTRAITENTSELSTDPAQFLGMTTGAAQNAVSIARLCYQKAEAEVDLAGAKASREQLEALVLRADAYLRQTNAYMALLTGSGNEINRGKRRENDALCNAITTGIIGVEAAAVYMSATARLAAFLETN